MNSVHIEELNWRRGLSGALKEPLFTDVNVNSDEHTENTEHVQHSTRKANISLPAELRRYTARRRQGADTKRKEAQNPLACLAVRHHTL